MLTEWVCKFVYNVNTIWALLENNLYMCCRFRSRLFVLYTLNGSTITFNRLNDDCSACLCRPIIGNACLTESDDALNFFFCICRTVRFPLLDKRKMNKFGKIIWFEWNENWCYFHIHRLLCDYLFRFKKFWKFEKEYCYCEIKALSRRQHLLSLALHVSRLLFLLIEFLLFFIQNEILTFCEALNISMRCMKVESIRFKQNIHSQWKTDNE